MSASKSHRHDGNDSEQCNTVTSTTVRVTSTKLASRLGLLSRLQNCRCQDFGLDAAVVRMALPLEQL